MIKYDEEAKGFLVLLLLFQIFFTNGIFLFVGAICFGLLFYYLQQPYKPAVFTLVFIYHFLQIAATVWLSNFMGEGINYRSPSAGTAVICSYVGMFFLFLPIIYYQNRIPAVSFNTLRVHAERFSIQKSFRIYIIAFFIVNSLAAVAFLFPGLTQIIFSLVKIKWFFYILFGMQVVLKKKMVKPFIYLSLFEFITGFYSYFSEYKTILFFLGFIFLIFLRRLSLKQLVLTLLVAISGFFLGAFYQGIKGDYRQYLNQGGKGQEVLVTQEDALGKLVDLASNQEDGSFSGSVEMFLDRLQYTFHLAKAMDYVPAVIPYEEGANWGATLDFALTPRILNPNKPKYEATVKTIKYTGLRYAGARQGVSFSLGYFADSYVDFGYYGMFFPILIIGWIFGSTYFYFVRKSSNNLIFNFAVVGAMYMEFIAYEMDGTFLTGRLFATLVTFFALKILAFPRILDYLSVHVRVEGKNIKQSSLPTEVTRL